MTTYIVLKRFLTPVAGWEIIGHAEASNPQVARKAVDAGDGEYLAVPIRNATFISGTTEQPPPKAISVEVSADTYLDIQLPLAGEASDEPREGIEVPADGSTHELTAA